MAAAVVGGFKGVRTRPSGKYCAEIKVSGRKRYLWLGTFDTAESAARAYDAAARDHHGPTAHTNFPIDSTTVVNYTNCEKMWSKEKSTEMANTNLPSFLSPDESITITNSSLPLFVHPKQPDELISAVETKTSGSNLKSDAKKMTRKEKSTTGDVNGEHFRGVRKRLSGRYTAQIKCWGRKIMCLGTFNTAEEAARAYDAAANEYHGAKAKTNFTPISSPDRSITTMDSSPPLFVQPKPHDGLISAVESKISCSNRRCDVKKYIEKAFSLSKMTSKKKSMVGDVNKEHFRGVQKRLSGRYSAQIRFSGQKNLCLGTFDKAEEAALAYDKAAIQYHGAKANTNFPLTLDRSPPLFLQPEQHHEPISVAKKKMTPKEKLAAGVDGDVNEVRFRGVWKKPSGRYGAYITPCRKGRRMWLGTFSTAEEAARAHDVASHEYHGDMANTNFPLSTEILSPRQTLKCAVNRVHKEEPNSSDVDHLVNGTDPRPTSRDCCARENNLKYNSKTRGEAKKRKLCLKNVKDNKLKGVCKRSSGRYGAEFKVPGQKTRVWLGTFDTAEEAKRAYDAASHAYDSSSPEHRHGLITCNAERVHMAKPSDMDVDRVVDGTDAPMSIDCCARENNPGEKAVKRKLLCKNVEGDKSMITNCILSSDNKRPKPTSVVSQLVPNFENFKIIVNGSIVDPELSHGIRKKYFDLCSKRRSVLHCRFLNSVTAKLAAEIISETTKISERIRDCELKNCGDDLKTWDKTLASFEMLGMDVAFIRARINRLLGLLWDSEIAVDKISFGECNVVYRRIDCWFREEANESW